MAVVAKMSLLVLCVALSTSSATRRLRLL